MRALSLAQPWAAAVAYDLKSVETRSWRTHYRGPLLIHASARDGSGAGAEHAEQIVRSLVPSVEFEHGGIVAVATLHACIWVEDVRETLTGTELALGDYSDGRWAWLLHNVVRLPPIPCRGALGLWDVPETVERIVRAQVEFV